MEAQDKPAPQAAPILKAAELPLNGCAGNRMTRRKLPTTASFAAYHAVHGKWKAMYNLFLYHESLETGLG